MARRGAQAQDKGQDKSVDTGAQAPESTENDNTQAPAEGATTEAQAPTKAEPDLTAFKAAVQAALDEGDETTGVLPEASKQGIAKAYRDLDGQKEKNAAKALLDEGVKQSIIGSNLPHARSYTEARDAVNEATAKKSEATPADPKAAYVTRLASLRLAESVLTSQVDTEKVNVDEAQKETGQLVDSLAEDVTKYQTWLDSEAEDKGDAPEVSAIVKAAFKLAAGKASGSVRKSGGTSVSSGERRDVGKHIEQAFADVEPGTFLKISQIANFKSDEYGEDRPSQGAVSARLFPPSGGKCTVKGVQPVQKDESKNQPRGASKRDDELSEDEAAKQAA